MTLQKTTAFSQNARTTATAGRRSAIRTVKRNAPIIPARSGDTLRRTTTGSQKPAPKMLGTTSATSLTSTMRRSERHLRPLVRMVCVSITSRLRISDFSQITVRQSMESLLMTLPLKLPMTPWTRPRRHWPVWVTTRT